MAKGGRERVKVKEEIYQELVEILHQGIWMVDENAITTFVNQHMADMLGYSVDEMVEKSIFSFCSPDGQAVIRKKVANRKRGMREQYDAEFIRKDGSTIYVSVAAAPLFDAQGNHRGSATMMSDISERKKMELTLARNLHFIQALMDTMPHPLYYTDLSGRFLGCNESFANILGVPKEGLAGRSIHDVVPVETTAIFCKSDQELLAVGGTRSYQEVFTDHAGRKHPVMMCKAAFKGENGKPAGLIGLILDISELKNTQEVLARRLRYEEAVTRCSSILLSGQAFQDPVGEVFSILVETTGVSRVYRFINFRNDQGELCMRQLKEVCASGIPSQIDEPELLNRPYSMGAERWEEMLSQGRSMAGDTSRFPERERRFFESQGIKSVLVLPVFIEGAWDGFIGFDETKEERIWTEEDIRLLKTVIEMIQAYEEQRKFEKELSESEAKLRAVTSAAKDAIIMIDTEGKVNFWNEAATTILQYSAAEALGIVLHEFIAPERYRQSHVRPMDHFRLTGQGSLVGKTIELAAKRKDGVEIPIELSLSAVKLNGEWNAVGIMRDISERKKAEADKQAMMEMLIQSEKMASLGEMAGGIAHELNTPLGVIIGYLQLMDKKMSAEDKLRAYAQTCLEEAEVCRKLIGDLLLYSRPVEAAGMDIEKVSLADVVESALKLMSIHKYNNITVHLDLDKTAPPVLASRKQLTHLVINLARNSIQAMSNGGRLNVCVKAIHESTELRGEWVELNVRDTGEGIPPENIHKIFDPFFTTRRPGKGTGMGLSICLRFIEQMGGKIKIESEPGQGTTAVVLLPVHHGPSQVQKREE